MLALESCDRFVDVMPGVQRENQLEIVTALTLNSVTALTRISTHEGAVFYHITFLGKGKSILSSLQMGNNACLQMVNNGTEIIDKTLW
jgi:hypothetical protein